MTLVLKDILLAPLDLLLIHIIQDTHTEFNIIKELITSTLAEILSDNHAQHLEIFGVGRHGVGWNDPAPTAQLVGECEFIVVVSFLGVEAECDEGETGAALLGHDDES